jgi:uncharacterized protein (TIGR03663 family)
MARASAGVLVALVVIAGLGLRLARLDVRPMHHDEANQAVKFGTLVETGDYRYDAHDHHGPTLYYLALPAAWMRGQHTLASLDETTLRGVTAVFGAATVLLLPLLFPALGRTAVLSGALLMALSPAMVFYSRMFIQESLFACFTLAFALALGRIPAAGLGFSIPGVPGAGLGFSVLEYRVSNRETYPGKVSPLTVGLAAGLAIATKETAVIVLPAAVVACGIAWWSMGHRRLPDTLAAGRWRVQLATTAGIAALVAALFYSSLFAHPDAILEPLRGAGTYVERGTTVATHAQPWHYYLGLLAWTASGRLWWSEGLVLALAVVGALAAWLRRPAAGGEAGVFWGRYLSAYAVIAGAAFSAIPYKTPWNLLPFYAAVLVVAGIGASTLVLATRVRALRVATAGLLLAAAAQLGLQAWRASVTYASDPRNPYVYAQTVPDAVRMAARIRDLAALDPAGARMQVSVIAPPHEQWPLPWYLRTMPNVGYWDAPGDPLALVAPVVVSSTDHAPALDAALGERYASEYFGLRPEVLLALYVERGLYDRLLARIADARLKPCPTGDPCHAGLKPRPTGDPCHAGLKPCPTGDLCNAGLTPSDAGLKPHPTSALRCQPTSAE